MKVSDFMITNVISITKEKTIKELLEMLVENHVGGVPVVDDSNKLLGIISDGDVIRYLQPKGRTVYDMFSLVLVSEKEDFKHKLGYAINQPAEELLRHKKAIHTVHPEDKLDAAIETFSKYRFKKIPVVDDDNRVVGVVSRGDVIRYITTNLIK